MLIFPDRENTGNLSKIMKNLCFLRESMFNTGFFEFTKNIQGCGKSFVVQRHPIYFLAIFQLRVGNVFGCVCVSVYLCVHLFRL